MRDLFYNKISRWNRISSLTVLYDDEVIFECALYGKMPQMFLSHFLLLPYSQDSKDVFINQGLKPILH